MLYPVQKLPSPNFEPRQGYKPILFCLHITDGQDAVRSSDAQEESAVQNTFMSPASCCSAHDEIERDGRIKQYVEVENAAWTQGLHGPDEIAHAPSPIVRNMGCNPNLYAISIELLAYKDHGGDGQITEEQFWALCWRIKCRQDEVFQKFGHRIPLNSTYVIGHCHVDPINRKFDPGPKFPWARLYAELAIADSMSLADYEGRIQMLRSPNLQQNHAYDIANEVLYLWNLSQQPTGEGEWAKGVLLRLHPVMTSLGLLTKPYDEKTSAADVYNQALYMYNLGKGTDGNAEWAKNELLKMYPFMLQNGLVPAA